MSIELKRAIRAGDLNKTVKESENITLNKLDKEGSSAIHTAAIVGNRAIIDVLVKAGWDLNLKDKHGATPILRAIMEEHSELVKHLISFNVDVQTGDVLGRSPLFWATSKGNIDIIRSLLTAGASIKGQTKDGFTALHKSIEVGKSDIFNLLLDFDADVNAQNKYMRTALHMCVTYDRQDFVDALIRRGADIDHADKEGSSALHDAAKLGRINICKQLLKSANINLQNNLGQTPLHIAIESGHSSIVDILIASGAKLDIKNNLGQTAANLALSLGKLDIYKTISKNTISDVQNNEGWGEIHFAAKSGDVDTIQNLIAKGINPGTKTKSGQTALHIACESGNISVAKELIKNKSLIERSDTSGMRPLHCAARNGYRSIVNELYKARADLNAQTKAGYTALHFASEKGHKSIKDDLILYGANPTIKTQGGKTMIDFVKPDKPVTWPRYIKSFFSRIDEYKSHHQHRDEVYAYKMVRKKLDRKVDTALEHILKEAVKGSSVRDAIDTSKLNNNYITDTVNQNMVYITNTVVKLNDLGVVKPEKGDFSYRDLGKIKEYAKIMLKDFEEIEECRVKDDEHRNRKAHNILDNTKAKADSETYSRQTLDVANWNAYRSVGWINYIKSFFVRVDEYETYYKVLDHRKSHLNTMQGKIKNIFEKLAGVTNESSDINNVAVDTILTNVYTANGLSASKEQKESMIKAAAKYNSGNSSVNLPFGVKAEVYGSGHVKKLLATREALISNVAPKYR